MNKQKCTGGWIAVHIILYFIAAVMLIPFVWLLLASLRPNIEILTEPFSVPKTLNFNNYVAVIQAQPIFRYLLNSVLVALIASLLNITIASMASFALLFPFKGNSKIAGLFYLGLFIPVNAFMQPYYVMINQIGLYDNISSLMIVYAVINLPMSIMVIRGYMQSIPMELMESAMMDGANIHRSFISVILPLSVPGIVTATVFVVLNSWNELLFANLLNQSNSSRTVQVAIKSFLSAFSANYGNAFAAMIICILPSIIAYAFLTDKIIDGMTAGAVKG